MKKLPSYRSLVHQKIELDNELKEATKNFFNSKKEGDEKAISEAQENLVILAERLNKLEQLLRQQQPLCSTLYHKMINILSNGGASWNRVLEREINGIHFIYGLKAQLSIKSFTISLTRKIPVPGYGLFGPERYAENQLFKQLAHEARKVCSSYLLSFSIREEYRPSDGTIAFWDLRKIGFEMSATISDHKDNLCVHR